MANDFNLINNVILNGNIWVSGSLSAPNSIIQIGIFNIRNYGSKDLVITLNNQGTIVHDAGGDLYLNNSAQINNQVGAVYEAQDAEIRSASGANGTAFNNAGTLKKTSSSNAIIDVEFNNTGQVNVEQGILLISGGGVSDNGQFNIAHG